MDDRAGDRAPIGSAWRIPGRAVAAVVCATVAILGLAALIGAADLSWFDEDQRRADERAAERAEAQQRAAEQAAGAGGEGGASGATAGPDGPLRLEPIPGCPGGLSINDEVLIVPDPEACGFRPLAPGEQYQDSGQVIITPDASGDIGGLRIDESGNVEMVPLDEVDADTITITETPNGELRFDGLDGFDGGSVTVEGDGDGSLVITTPDGEYTVEGDGSFGQLSDEGFTTDEDEGITTDEGTQTPENATPPSPPDPQPDQDSDDSDSGWSFPDLSSLGPVLAVLAIVAAAGFGAVLVKQFLGRSRGTSEAATTPGVDSVDSVSESEPAVDFSEEIDAIDRMLWEIDQEPDPRLAIQRVYAAVETGLGNQALARRSSETPGVYLQRVLGRDAGLEAPLAVLTHLFEVARFSHHPITPEMRGQAIDALQTIRSRYELLSFRPTPAQHEGIPV